MVFESLFGKSNKAKKERVGEARAQQFKEAWLLANRSLLAAKQQNEKADTAVEEETLENKATQFMQDQKESFSSDARITEQLTIQLMPVVNQIYAQANRYINDADVSSAHNTTYQRILDWVNIQTSNDSPMEMSAYPPDFSDEENRMLSQVVKILTSFWKENETDG